MIFVVATGFRLWLGDGRFTSATIAIRRSPPRSTFPLTDHRPKRDFYYSDDLPRPKLLNEQIVKSSFPSSLIGHFIH